MKNITLAAAVFLCSSVASFAHAQATSFGMRTCGDWKEKRVEEQRGTTGIKAIGVNSYLMGYLSGINALQYMESDGAFDPLERLSADSIYEWMNKYCDKAEPTAPLAAASFDMFAELFRKRASEVEKGLAKSDRDFSQKSRKTR